MAGKTKKSDDNFRYRDADKGRFIKEEQAKAKPRESIKDHMPVARRPKKK